jgi:hypothetical protein
VLALGQAALLLKSDERENENTANGWELLPGGFRQYPSLEPIPSLVEIIRFERSFCHNE